MKPLSPRFSAPPTRRPGRPILPVAVLLAALAGWMALLPPEPSAQTDRAATPPPAGSAEATTVAPQGPPRGPQEVSKVALKLQLGYMSPYCPGANLRDCGSGQAEVLRQEIRDWLAAGYSEEWITQQLVARFGDSILGAPPFRGIGMLAYIIPVLVVLVGLGVVLAFLQRQKRVVPLQPVDSPGVPEGFVVTDRTRQRVEAEVDAWNT